MLTILRTLPSSLTLVLLMALAPLEPTPALAATSSTPAQTPVIYACQEGRDGPLPCVWDGEHMGNGIGSSYIVKRSGEQIRVTHYRAHRLMTQGR